VAAASIQGVSARDSGWRFFELGQLQIGDKLGI
jgi:hypothetical protein